LNERLDDFAIQHKDAGLQIRAAINSITLQKILTGNGQEAGIRTLKERLKSAVYPVKPVLESLLAELYWNYYRSHIYQFGKRSRQQRPDPNFINWDLITLSREAAHLYQLSLAEAGREQSTPLGFLGDVLQGDTATRRLRPSLYDLLLHRALDCFLSNDVALTQTKRAFQLNNLGLFGNSRAFAALKIYTTDTTLHFLGIRYLQQATLFHLQQGQTDALADIDLQRLAFMEQYADIADKDSLYIAALEKTATVHVASAISADALVLIGKYYTNRNELTTAVAYFRQALAAYPQSQGGKNAANYIRNITQTSIDAITEDVNVPGKPILASLGYRNVKTARVTLYKLWATQYNEMAAIKDNRYGYSNTYIQPLPAVMVYLKKIKPLTVSYLHLPGTDDFRSHRTEFSPGTLGTGIYAMIVEDSLSKNPEALQFSTFKVSHFAFATRQNPDGRAQVTVMDCETGTPMPGVQVTANETLIQPSDAKGNAFFQLESPVAANFSVKMTTATDTLYVPRQYRNPLSYKQTAPTKRVVLFTDRQIYRPGQTVYFKGIYLSILNGKSSLLTGEQLTVSARDNSGKNFVELPLVTNDFGSVSGSFVIPQDLLNGIIYIYTPSGQKFIRVEAYKRPNFSVALLPVIHSYKPGDSVTIKGRATSYSGYGLSGALVAYHITRFPKVTDYRRYNYSAHPFLFTAMEIAADTVKTNERGEFELRFRAQAISMADRTIAYDFNITADVTNGSSETQSANTSLTVAVNNLKLMPHLPAQLRTTDTTKLSVRLQNLNGIAESGDITLNVYALKPPGRPFKNRLWPMPDQYLLNADAFRRDFPDYAYRGEDNKDNWPVMKQLPSQSLLTDASSRVAFDPAILKQEPTGTYRLVFHARNAQGDTVSEIAYIEVLNKPSATNALANFATFAGSDPKHRGATRFWVGTGAPAHVLMERFKGAELLSSQWLKIAKNPKVISLNADSGFSGQRVQFLMVYRNRQYVYRQNLDQQVSPALNIRLLTFRDRLQPGEKEEWKLRITGKEKQAAEMVADLYDTSLDAVANQDYWPNLLRSGNYYPDFLDSWSNGFTSTSNTHPLNYTGFNFQQAQRDYEHINRFYSEEDANKVFTSVEYKMDAREYVATADPGQIILRGSANRDMIIDEPVGSAVQVADDYGEQVSVTAKPVSIRRNFAETAFFYPQLHTDEEGNILLDFTLPDELTNWRFRAFAHNKNLETGYLEREIVTQKKLSIVANAPRFLREGDTVVISATLANLTATALKGKVRLQLFNALNGKPLSLLINTADSNQPFDLAATTNKPVSFKLAIPGGLDALRFRLTAESGQYSDGEENTLPVLSNRMLVTESMPMMVRAGQRRLFTFAKLLNPTSTTLKSKTLTLEYTQNPGWYAVQALPYLMEFPDECSEQVFNSYYANSLAGDLISKQPAIKQVFDHWKSSESPELLSDLEKNPELKATLLEETPWLQDATNETEQKKRISLLFDVNRMSYEQEASLNKLRQTQLANGGFPWFGSGDADRYITQNILAGMGQLYHLHVLTLSNLPFKAIADKAMAYVDDRLTSDAMLLKSQKAYDNRLLAPLEIHSYYTQSYFTERILTADQQALLNNYLNLAQKQWVYRSVYEKGMIALTMLRNQRPVVAAAIIRSLSETAQRPKELGMYWVKNKAGYHWYESPVETQSLLIELFIEAGNHDKDIDEMKIWLLRNKQTNNWATTKATAAACYALLLKGSDLISENSHTEIKLNGKPLAALKPGSKTDAGTGYTKTSWADEQVKPGLGKVELTNSGNLTSWGALHWQYLENLDKIKSAETKVKLERKYFIKKETAAGPVLTAVDAAHQPKTGDLLKVVIYLKADRDFEYIQLKDMRPSGTEPVDALSAYKSQDGIAYYQVTKDVATDFFINYLNKGDYVFEYELRVAQPGSFSTGITTMQSMYAPGFNAHATGMRMHISR
jgi:hypothetical protein